MSTDRSAPRREVNLAAMLPNLLHIPHRPVSLADVVADKPDSSITPADFAGATSESTKMLLALAATGKHVYPGTVPGHVKARRRAAGKRARDARRAGR